jgi:flagellar hook-associated protein 3 FlgL
MALTRVTQTSISQGTLRNLQNSLTRVQTLENQLSSGRRVSVASDDPAATADAMALSSQKASDDQYLRNIDYATSRLGITDNTLTSLNDSLRGVRNLVVQAQNGSLTSSALSALGDQVAATQSEVVDLYNTRYLDQSLFGGTISNQNAVDPDPASSTYLNYLGNDAPISTRVGRDSTVRVDVKGTDAAANTVPALMTTIAADIKSGNTSGLSADLTALDAAMNTVTATLGDVGAREARIRSTKNLVQAHLDDTTNRISENLDIDLPATIMNVQLQQVSYQSALAATSKVLSKSLVDYLA